jgi:hypothetical protein
MTQCDIFPPLLWDSLAQRAVINVLPCSKVNIIHIDFFRKLHKLIDFFNLCFFFHSPSQTFVYVINRRCHDIWKQLAPIFIFILNWISNENVLILRHFNWWYIKFCKQHVWYRIITAQMWLDKLHPRPRCANLTWCILLVAQITNKIN